ncbi:hypothetical protein ASG56_13315 [Rhodococcus sp. Leaf7]|jgi:hypothetical protein|uniref:Rv0361 family membrane protein n=1 Tax=unclassified Rhodococcus (in: high G+C Gram-positive bacteria) TaxID=192944 RepID=UPI0005AC2D1A|nr:MULTISPECIES: hypothetical protein [unclassified Rhodococcus (in: high G+C Gram-positive bacteria)]KIQ10854.1 hypothetical protein RU01_18960 [Rhodococcus sp. MEB064]KQU04343.1 hypothetical protein ASG56_13315 [Rhodococcus sp. Leaf7]KQU40528.1 hypothetical protein ASG64_13305 [Rhodococcus sp. Leaf247]
MTDPEPERSTTAAPIIAAAAVVVVVAVIIAVLSLTGSPDENVSDNQRVGTAVAAYVEATKSGDTAAVAALQCPGIVNAPLADAGTEVELKNIEEVRVKDDTAEADVRVSLDGTEESLTWSATRVGDDWLLCSP